MQEHIKVGREYPSVDLNTSYSFGLDDQEFVVAFETDNPADFLDLVQRLRTTESSSYTLRDTPTFTCISCSVERALGALDGAPLTARGCAQLSGLRRDPRHHRDRRRAGRVGDGVLGRDARGQRAGHRLAPRARRPADDAVPGEVDLRRARPPEGARARDLVELLREQAIEQFDVPVHLNDDRRDDLVGGRGGGARRRAAHRQRRAALADGDRRRRPWRVRAEEAAGLRHDAVGRTRAPTTSSARKRCSRASGC